MRVSSYLPDLAEWKIASITAMFRTELSKGTDNSWAIHADTLIRTYATSLAAFNISFPPFVPVFSASVRNR
jgi:hypothetical protein